MQVIEDAENGVDEGQSGNSAEQEKASSVAIDCGQCDQGEDQIHRAGNDDVEEDA